MACPTIVGREGMLPDSPPPADRRRLALVVAACSATAAAPPGVDPRAFAAACLADVYEGLADLAGISSGVVGDGDGVTELLWPGAVQLSPQPTLRALVTPLAGRYDEVVLVPADVPDLPGLVLAKVFKALQRAEVCVAPERGGDGCVALGLRLPWPSWVDVELHLDEDPLVQLRSRAPDRTVLATGPDWHRLRTPAALHRLDPGLAGWQSTRSLLSGRPLA